MKFGLKENIIENINKIFSAFPEVEEVILYGSRAKGNYKNGSDIDLVLKGEKINHSLVNKIDLKLDDLLLPYTFDLAVYSRINNADLLDHIHRVGKTIYKKGSSIFTEQVYK